MRNPNHENKTTQNQMSLFSNDRGDRSSSVPAPNFPPISEEERDHLFLSLLALKAIKGVGFKTLSTLFDAQFLQHFHDWAVRETIRQWHLLSDQIRVNLDPSVFDTKSELLAKAERKADEIRAQGIEFAPLGSLAYPKRLLRLAQPPRWLFVKGSLEAIKSESIVAVVGTRNSSRQGEALAKQCATQLVKRNIIILSGLAKGIDESAHLGAVENYGQSIAVLGHGMDASDGSTNSWLYQRILDLDGAVISEYLPSDPPSRESFLRRNELQVALAKVVMPIECPTMESGTGATIRRAINIETPIAGVYPTDAKEKSLELTKQNLENLKIPVFIVRSENSNEFWTFLETEMAEHDWRINPIPRQERFLRNIEKQILAAKKNADLDDDAIDRLATRLKSKLRE